ncbi:MAG: YbaB/EbfC family nucleoid-associated protein [Flavobacteriales bacterium]
MTVQGSSAAGNVKIEISGNRVVKGITIDKSWLNQNQDHVESELISAMNNAIEQADKVNEAEMKSAASSMMPGLGGMFK